MLLKKVIIKFAKEYTSNNLVKNDNINFFVKIVRKKANKFFREHSKVVSL